VSVRPNIHLLRAAAASLLLSALLAKYIDQLQQQMRAGPRLQLA